MKIGVPKEICKGEARVALTPAAARRLQKLGYDCLIESGAGEGASIPDRDYAAAGVTVAPDAAALWSRADIIAKVREPEPAEIDSAPEGKTLISFFHPAQNDRLLAAANEKNMTVLAMDMVPRISRAQKMDALSSMANIAGYRAVIEAGHNFGRFFTGQITAAGKVPPAEVLVIGAGVAGLAAIGASVSLGAVTLAFDVRPEVAEQIESMGAEFVFLDFEDNGPDGSATGGYAAPSSPEFRDRQLEKFRELAPKIDIVIATALIPGRPAPKLWLEDMVAAMKPGSVVVDLAAAQGGNCDLTVKDEKIVSPNGVAIIGHTDFPSRMAAQASALYAVNIAHMIDDLTPERDGNPIIDMEDDVIRGALVCRRGAITFPPPPPKVKAIAPQPKRREPAETPEQKAARERAAVESANRRTAILLGVGGALLLLVGAAAPPGFMRHVAVFALACFVGFHVIWNVAHALHTPLMAVTNAISSIVIVGALLQVGSAEGAVTVLAAVSILMAAVNIFGGFLVTRRMLAMFRKS